MGAITKVGAVAKMSGVSIQELEGYTTSLVASTGITGDEAGVALKAMMSRMYRIGPEGEEDAGKSEDTLKRLGIAVRNAQGQFRAFGDILTDINQKWNQWTNVQQISVAQTISGTHHYSKFVNLMENYGLAVNATNVAINSQGSAFRENEKYMDSIQGKLAVLKATLEEKWSDMLNSDMFKHLIEGLTKVVDGFVSWGNITWTIIGALAVLKSSAIADLITSMGSLIPITKAYSASLAGAAASADVLTVAQKTATIAATGLKGALGWIGIIMLAIQGATIAFKAFTTSQEEAREAILNLNKTFEAQRAEIQGITAFYEKNKEILNSDATIREQLYEMQEKLISQYGEEGRILDEVNGKLEVNIQKMRQLRYEQAKQETDTTAYTIDEIASKTYSIDYSKFDIKPDLSGKRRGGYSTFSGIMWGGFKDSLGENVGGIEEYYNRMQMLYKEITNSNYAAERKLSTDKWKKRVEEVKKQLDEAQGLYDVYTSLEEKQKNEELLAWSTSDWATPEQSTLIEKLVKPDDNRTLSEFQKHLQKVGLTIKEMNGSNTDQIIQKLIDIGLNADLVNSAFGKMPEAIDEPQLKSFETLAGSVKETCSAVQDLTDIQGELNKGNKLSTDSMLDMITKYPDLIDYIKLTGDGYTVEADGINIVKKALLEKQKQALLDELNISKAVVEGVKARLGAYGAEVEGIDTLAKARELARKANPDSYNSPLDQEARNAQYQKDLEALTSVAKINALIEGLEKGVKIPTKKDSSASKTALEYKDMADASIRAFNAEAEKQKLQTASIERQIKIAEKQKDYNAQLKLTNDLMKSQKDTIEDLNEANRNISNKANQLRSNAKKKIDYKYLANEDINSWFDVNGEATEAYAKTLNRDAGKNDDVSKKRRAEIEAMFKAIYDLKKAWRANTDEVFALNDAIDATAESIEQINQEKMQRTTDLQSQMMNLRKKQYQAELDEESKRHEDYLEKLDDEKTAYEEMIQGKLDALDRLHSAEDYDRDISKKNKKILEVQQQIDALSMDNSAEAMARKAELQKQMETLSEEKADTVRKHEQEAEKDSLENLLSEKQKAIEKEIDLENDKWETIQDKFESIMSDEQLLAQTTNELLKTSAAELMAIYGELFQKFEGGATSAGLAAKSSLLDSIRTISNQEQASSEDPKQTVGLRAWLVSKGIPDSEITFKDGKVYVKGTAIDTSSGYTNTNGRLYATIERIRKSLADAKISFDSGGYTGENEGMAYLHRKEIILNQMDTKNFLKAIDITRMMAERLNAFNSTRFIPDRVASKIEANFELNVTTSEGQDPLEVAKVVEKYVWDNMSRKLASEGI